MSFVSECNKYDRYDTMHEELAWQSKLLINKLWFISLFVLINEMSKI